ncbi:AI-2E family transporter [Thermococcus sp.]|uniref:AI-2E family transporter n=1 Tax=Thermococcus sp. TaxID=35749 RepID=UPI002624AE91|nr:AI-2E family transporter [Thermococcus sp.]
MNREKLGKATWAAVVLVILYVSWKTVEPLVTAIFFGVVLAYLVYPIHRLLKGRIGDYYSAIALTVLMLFIGGLLFALMALVSVNLLQTFYHSLSDVMNWLTALNLPPSIGKFVFDTRTQLLPRVSDYVSSFTFSIPGYLLQLTVLVFTFYYSLVYSDRVLPFIMSLAPPERKNLLEEAVGRLDRTMSALVRAWLLLNLAKSVLMTIGYLLFGVSDVYTAVVAGFLTFVFSFVPLLEGWMLWVAAAVYFVIHGSIIRAVGISIYGFALVSPLPDYTIRPMLVARDADLDETLVFVGMLGGAWAFGLKGILLGPIILSMALVLIKEWKERHALQTEEQSTSLTPAD